MVENLPANAGDIGKWFQSQHWEETLEKGMATRSSILAWRNPWTDEPGGLQSIGSQRVRHDWATNTTTTYYLLSYQAQLFHGMKESNETHSHKVYLVADLKDTSNALHAAKLCVSRRYETIWYYHHQIPHWIGLMTPTTLIHRWIK